MSINRDYCPLKKVLTGDNLTRQLIEDHRPYLDESALPWFEKHIHEWEDAFEGPVSRIEYFGFHDGSPGIHTILYWFGNNYDPDYPDREFNTAMAGVERFPE